MDATVLVRALLCVALVAVGVQAQAARAEGCGAAEARSPAPEARPSGPVLQVTDAHTEGRPLTVRYEHRPGANAYHQVHVEDDLVHTLVQVRTQSDGSHLWVRAEFAETLTDIDLYAYDARGRMRDASDSANNPVEDEVHGVVFYGSDSGGPGYENIDAMAARRCETFTVETQNTMVLQPTPVTLRLWLGPPAP